MRTVRTAAAIISILFYTLVQGQDEISDLRSMVGELQKMVRSQQQQIQSLQEKVSTLESSQSGPAAGETALGQSNPLAKKAITGRTPAPLEAAPGPKVSSRFNLDFYGYLKLDASYDSQRTASGDLAFYSLPESGDGDDDSISLTAKQTRLGMKIEAPEVNGWGSSGRLEMDFYGSASDNAANPRMRLAYLELKKDDWTILAGQNYDAWNTILPKTVNFATMAKHGSLWSRRAQVRATRSFELDADASVAATLGAARTTGLSDIDASGDGLDGGEDSGTPTLQWNLNYTRKVDSGNMIFAVGGHYGNEDVERSALEREVSYVTSLVIGSFHLPVSTQLTVSGTIWTGENINSWLGGIGQGINLALNTEIASAGGWLQACWYPSPGLNFNFAYGIDDPVDSDLSNGQRDRNQSWFTNFYWTIVPSTTLAFEYQYLKTGYKNSDEATTHRVQSALLFKF